MYSAILHTTSTDTCFGEAGESWKGFAGESTSILLVRNKLLTNQVAQRIANAWGKHE